MEKLKSLLSYLAVSCGELDSFPEFVVCFECKFGPGVVHAPEKGCLCGFYFGDVCLFECKGL
jgi:hypothetical protein